MDYLPLVAGDAAKANPLDLERLRWLCRYPDFRVRSITHCKVCDEKSAVSNGITILPLSARRIVFIKSLTLHYVEYHGMEVPDAVWLAIRSETTWLKKALRLMGGFYYRSLIKGHHVDEK